MKLFKNKKTIKSVHRSIRSYPFINRVGRDPYIDWVVIVTTAFIFAMIIVSISFLRYLYFGSTLRSKISAISPGILHSIDTKPLDEILKKFDDREVLRVNLLHGYAGSNDPSI